VPSEDGGEPTWVPAATNVGVRPQFVTGRGELIEAYLIDWSGDLYDRTIRVEFLRRLRGERRFESVDALVEQMHADVDEARRIATATS
jgi:riboflavin kinase/FMN adenylyltransferase